MKQYYYLKGIEKHGPFAIEELNQEKITQNTMIWFKGIEEWRPAKDFSELKILFPFKKTYHASSTRLDVIILVALVLWLCSILFSIIAPKVLPNWYETPIKYIQFILSLNFCVIPFILVNGMKDMSIKIVGYLLAGLISLYLLYSNLTWFFKEVELLEYFEF